MKQGSDHAVRLASVAKGKLNQGKCQNQSKNGSQEQIKAVCRLGLQPILKSLYRTRRTMHQAAHDLDVDVRINTTQKSASANLAVFVGDSKNERKRAMANLKMILGTRRIIKWVDIATRLVTKNKQNLELAVMAAVF